MVTLSQLLPNIHQLTFLDKIHLIRILAEDIDVSKAKEASFFEPNKTYFLHTPEFEPGAADILMNLLNSELKEH
jgi:hypothetical protein